MTAFDVCRGPRPRLLPALAFLTVTAAAGTLPHPGYAADPVAMSGEAVPAPSVGEPVVVHVDQAKVLKLPERTATLVVGNPLIADVAVQPGGIMVLTAKSYGVTNLVALDRTGTTLMEHPVHVLGPTDNIVVLYRGIERESYSCMPNCERRITLGDTPNYFTATLNQTGNLNTLAQGGQQK
jgi:Flp pilus assembly secretin CpaC